MYLKNLFDLSNTNKKKLIVCGSSIFVIIVIIIYKVKNSVPKPVNSPPTSVKTITNSSTTTISSSLISPGTGVETIGVNTNYGPNSFTLLNNGGDVNNPNTATVNIKYAVTKGSVYQITLVLVTKNVPSTFPIVSSGNVYLLPLNGMFVLDDLKTPVVSDSITVPMENINVFTFNIKWTSSNIKFFTLTFKFPTKADSIMVDGMKITKLK
jgi:hypothetical protein